MKFEASIVGAKLKLSKSEKANEQMMFRAPEDYAHLTLEERKALTRKMKGMHKGINFAGVKKNG